MRFQFGGHRNGDGKTNVGHLVGPEEREVGNRFELRAEGSDDSFGLQALPGAGANFARHAVLGLDREGLAHVTDDAVAFCSADRH